MKKINWLLILMLIMGSATISVSCKNKKAETTQEDKSTNSNVEISSDATLRTNVDNVIKSYDGVSAEVKDGVVTLRGNVKQEDLQPLIMKVQELKPRKVENQLVIKS
jgi:osmotically-inducible protein OsmY